MDPRIRLAALLGFPAGFAAAAPFLAELTAHVPFIALGAEVWDSHTQYFDAVNAGEIGKALGPLWILFELLLWRAGSRRGLRWAAGAALVCAVGPAIHWIAALPWDFRWMAWGVALTAGLALARIVDPASRALWAAWPALVTLAGVTAWRYAALPHVAWGVMALKPAFAGAVAGLVVRVGRDQGLRWGRPSPADAPAQT